MAVTILEALQNANYNLNNAEIPLQIEIAKEQLRNAVTLLEKGYRLQEEVEPLLEEYGDINSVPEVEE
jgi:hypothetical protein